MTILRKEEEKQDKGARDVGQELHQEDHAYGPSREQPRRSHRVPRLNKRFTGDKWRM